MIDVHRSYPREQERPLAPAAAILDPLPELQALGLGECLPVDRSWHRFCHPADPPMLFEFVPLENDPTLMIWLQSHSM